MIGTRVGELIGEAQVAVNWDAYPEDVAPLLHAHPTPERSTRGGVPRNRGKAAPLSLTTSHETPNSQKETTRDESRSRPPSPRRKRH